jgi:hypothetical protein
MSSQPPSATEQRQSPTAEEAPKRTGRLRSSCDNCHRSKIKCTGSTPCSACFGSQSTCTYSRGSRLGRPKGSKNKRNSSHSEKDGERNEPQQNAVKVNTDITQWPTVDLGTFDAGMDPGFGSVFSDNFVDGSILFNSNAGLMEPMSPKSRLDLQALFAQVRTTHNR